MAGWILPLAATSFGLGAFLGIARLGATWAWLALIVGVAFLSVAAMAGRRTRAPVLEAAGLVPGPDRSGPRLRILTAAGLAPAHEPEPRWRGGPAVGVMIGLVLLGAGWAGVRLAMTPDLSALYGRPMAFDGSAAADVERFGGGWGLEVRLDRARIGGTLLEVHARVRVEGWDRAPAVEAGERVSGVGTLGPLSDAGYERSLSLRGVAAGLTAGRLRSAGPPGNPFLRVANAARDLIRRGVDRVFEPREAGLLLGLMLGDTTDLDPGVERDFRATGLGHHLAVSGENVAMFLAPILGVAALLGAGPRARLAVGLAAVAFFALLTRWEPSVLRAAAMALLALTGVFLGRPRSTAALLGGAVLALLVLDPSLVLQLGFQLSVAATAGMAALAGPVADRLRWVPRPVGLVVGATVGAQAGVTPLLLMSFGGVPGVTLPANVAAMPAVGPAMLGGLAASATAAVWASLGRVLAAFTRLPLGWLMGVADRLGRAPFPWLTGGLLTAVIAGAVAVVAAWRLRRGKRVAAPVALAVLLSAWWVASRAAPPSELTVTFLDVGQGDAALVSSPAGAQVLIDGGPEPDVVATRLAGMGVVRLDAVVATHQHADHVVGLPTVLARFPVGVVFDSGCHPPESEEEPYRGFMDAVREEGVPEQHPTRGQVLVVGDLRFDVVSPDRCWRGTDSDPNNDSLVLRLRSGGHTVLFANEPEAEAQEVMLEDGVPLEAEVLNVPHHGAGTSIDPFLETVRETVAVVSVGPNPYGHPVPHTMEVLRTTAARVYRTDRAGDVEVRFEAQGMVVDTARGPPVLFER